MIQLLGIFGVEWFSELMQKYLNMATFKNSLTSDKETNVLIYGRNACLRHHIQELQTFKNAPVFWPTLYFI